MMGKTGAKWAQITCHPRHLGPRYFFFFPIFFSFLYLLTIYRLWKSPPHPSLAWIASWRGVPSLPLPTMPLSPPSLEMQNKRAFQLPKQGSKEGNWLFKSTCFLFYFSCFLVLNNNSCYTCIQELSMIWRCAEGSDANKTGPNDARHIVWASYVSFFKNLCVFTQYI